jgi:hypothetical protein
MADHFLDRVAMIGMLIPAAKHGIDKVSAPVHLQWLESFLLFVGWLNAVPTISIIVIQDHRVNAKLYYMRLNYFQAPEKQTVQKSPEQIDAYKRKALEKSFHHMGRGHLLHVCFDTPGISGIFLEMIEIDQVPAGAIHKKTEHLLEKLCDILALPTLPHRAEKPIQQREDLNTMQIGHEKSQSRSPCQFLAGRLNIADFQCAFAINFVIFSHVVLHLVGYAFRLLLFCGYYNNNRRIPAGGELFLVKNRSA